MTGSADLFDHDHRSPRSSINFITVHDGFTLADLVSYERKHNEANGEDNRDGSDENHSTNCGVEGPTEDPKIVELRRQLRRNLLSSLMLAQGVPAAGGRRGRQQPGGNNNAYCQDNPIGWVDWSALGRDGEDMTSLVALPTVSTPSAAPAALGRGAPPRRLLRRLWLTPQATEMTEQDWNFPEGHFLSYVLGPLKRRTASMSCSTPHRKPSSSRCPPSRNTAVGPCCAGNRAQAATGRGAPPARSCSAAALGSGIFRSGMMTSVRFGAELHQTA